MPNPGFLNTKTNFEPCSLDIQGIAWELYTQHCVCGQTKLALVEALWLAYRLIFFFFFFPPPIYLSALIHLYISAASHLPHYT